MNNNKTLIVKFKELAGHGLVYGIGTALESLIQIILIPIFLNQFTPKEYGVFSLIQLTAAMSAAFFYFGGSSALSRFYYEVKEENDKKMIFSNILGLTLCGSVLMLVVFFIFDEFVIQQLFGEIIFINAYYFLFLSFSISIINTVFFLLIRLLKKSKLFVFLKLLSLISTLFVIILLINKMENVLLATAIGFSVGQIILLIIMLIKFRSSIILTIKIKLLKEYLSFGMPIALSGLLFLSIDWIVRFFVSKDLGSENLGLYSMALKFGALIQAGFVIPFALIWGTIRMEYRNDNNTRYFFNKVTTYYFLAGFLIIFLISINIDQLFYILDTSKSYGDSYLIVPILLISQLIFGAINILDYGLFISNKTMFYAWYYFIGLVIVSILSFFFVKDFGIIGAAFIHLFGNCIISSFIYFKSNTYFKISIDYKVLFYTLLAGISLYITSDYFNFFIDESSRWLVFFKNIFIFIIFTTIIYLIIPFNERKKINKQIVNLASKISAKLIS